MEKKTEMIALEYLKCYLADLIYQFKTGSISYVNYNSAGTQYFETEEDCGKYIEALEKYITKRSKIIEKV
jgi:hypothetical protein